MFPTADFHEFIVVWGKPAGSEKFFQQKHKSCHARIDPQETAAKQANVWKLWGSD